MKQAKIETTFGSISFTAELSIDPDAAILMAAKHDLYHRINGKIEKAMGGTREVDYSKETADKLIAAYKAQGVAISNVRAYAPSPAAAAAYKVANEKYDKLVANGKLQSLCDAMGWLEDGKVPERSKVVALIHKGM